MKKIPLHSLVIIIGDNEQKRKFQSHECISTSQVHTDLVGKNQRPELDFIIRNEVFRRCALKLSLGERVVFHGSDLSKERRIALAKMASSQGAPVFYLLSDETKRLEDDDISEVLTEVDPVMPVTMTEIRKKFHGITVVGDIHGDVGALREAIAWAKSRNNFLWFLGDIVDYGPDPIEAINIVYKLVMHGEASTLIGNHERKIAKWLHNREDNVRNKMKLSDGNKVTAQAFNQLSHSEQMIWTGKFRSILAKSSLIVNVSNITLVHAAIHPDYWVTGKSNEIENYALYGEPDTTSREFKLTHKWIDSIPNGQIVIVGHESHGLQYPIPITSQNGGKVVFLDTGCGKGGPLSTADIQFTSEDRSLAISNFNRHLGI